MRRHLLYGSYTDKSNEVNQTGAGLMRERVRNVLIILLVAVIAVLGVMGGQAMRYRAEARSLFAATMQTESNEALSLANSLSRTAGANSSATLGRIRSSVRAMETVNRLHGNLDGGRTFLPEETFSELYAILENYSSRLQTGMNTGDLQGELQSALEALQVKISEL
ncbi:MAG: hypothetical protein J1E43_10470 [Christensenellaceae bacterium]|nr:hypothetical protein [Christensenellaceae bacterium]